MDFATKADLVDAVMAAILRHVADDFPTTSYPRPNVIATAIGLEFETFKKQYDQDAFVFPKLFGEDFNTLVRGSVFWLGTADFLVLDARDQWGIATLSERGARLMGCWPKCLGEWLPCASP